MHLKCTDHERRVIVLTDHVTVHRNGSQSYCHSDQISLGSFKIGLSNRVGLIRNRHVIQQEIRQARRLNRRRKQ